MKYPYRWPESASCRVWAMSVTETPSERARSRSISITSSGLLNLRFTSATLNTGWSCTSSRKRGRTSFSLSKFGACITYCTGRPNRAIPVPTLIVCSCVTMVRASFRGDNDRASASAISLCVRFLSPAARASPSPNPSSHRPRTPTCSPARCPPRALRSARCR